MRLHGSAIAAVHRVSEMSPRLLGAVAQGQEVGIRAGNLVLLGQNPIVERLLDVVGVFCLAGPAKKIVGQADEVVDGAKLLVPVADSAGHVLQP